MKKRRTETSGLEDAERTLHASFCAAANSISQLYTQAHTQHKIAFHAGQRQSLEKLCHWVQKHHHEFGSLPTTADILNYVKNEVDSINQNEVTVSEIQNVILSSHNQQNPSNSFAREHLIADQTRDPTLYSHTMAPGG